MSKQLATTVPVNDKIGIGKKLNHKLGFDILRKAAQNMVFDTQPRQRAGSFACCLLLSICSYHTGFALHWNSICSILIPVQSSLPLVKSLRDARCPGRDSTQ